MKYILILLVLFLVSCQNKEETFIKAVYIPSKVDSLRTDKEEVFIKAAHIPSRVDSLRTDEDVSTYLTRTDSNFNRFRLKPMKNFRFVNDDRKDYEATIRDLANTYNIDKSFYKADFDNNGYTDLLVTGDFFHDIKDPAAFGGPYVYALLNFGVRPPAICYLNNPYFAEVCLPKLETRGNETLLRLYTIPIQERKIHAKGRDTVSVLLSARAGGFVKHNNAPKHHDIEKIQYHAEGCYGKCPTFEITISADRSAWFIAYTYNFSDRSHPVNDTEGVFRTALSREDHEQITEFINYLDLTSLKDLYTVPSPHLPGAKLIITYDNGKTKTISDYGMNGTYGLKTFYDMMEKLRFNQDWKKSEEPAGLRIRNF